MNGKPHPYEMGCHGIGVTRIIAAAVETLSSDTDIRWPYALAPYSICIIPPKKNSKEEANGQKFLEIIYNKLKSEVSGLADEIIVDDRTKFTIGRRLVEVKR